MRIGIALGGGGARGWSHIGVLRALVRAGYEPHNVAGTSIGAIVGGAYAAGRLEELEAFARGMDRRGMWRLIDMNMATGGGLVIGEKIAQALGTVFGAIQIEALPTRFTAVATELETGNEVWFSEGSLVDGVRASYALPGILLPPVRDGCHLVDGGVVNQVPVSACRAMGAHVVIAVSLPAGPVASQKALDGSAGEEASAWRKTLAVFREPERFVARQLFGDKPGALTSASVSLATLNMLLDRVGRVRLAMDQPEVVITPGVSHIALLEFDRADEAIRIGEAAVESMLPEIEAMIARRKTPHEAFN